MVAVGSGAVCAAGLWQEQEHWQGRHQHSYPAVPPVFGDAVVLTTARPAVRGPAGTGGFELWVPSLPLVTIAVRERSVCHFGRLSKVRRLSRCKLPPAAHPTLANASRSGRD